MFDRRALSAIKAQEKQLVGYEFKPIKRNTMPPPLSKVGGARRQCTGLISVSEELSVCFLWRNGEILEQTAIYGWLFCKTKGFLVPLVRLDCHPSHKGLHMVLNCEGNYDLAGRDLVGGKEFDLSKTGIFDPRVEEDRARFISLFCELCKITLGNGTLL
jgi:hypothetical protein